MEPTITVSELRQRMTAGENINLVDVRSAGEYAAGHIPGAANIPMDQAEARLDDIAPNQTTVLVCQSGRRAGMTCDLLAAHRPNLVVLDGGTDAWVGASLPVVRTTATRWSLERQVRLGAGLLVLTGAILALTLHPAWVYLCLAIGAGLTFAGLTNICGMALLLAQMPWNKPHGTLSAVTNQASG